MTLVAGRAVIGDPDAYWHIATGRWIIAHGAVPHADLFSHTMSGAAWVAHEWLAEIVMAAIYDGLGWHGLAAMTGLFGGIALALFARAMLRSFEPVHALMAVAGAWLMLLPHWLARP